MGEAPAKGLKRKGIIESLLRIPAKDKSAINAALGRLGTNH
jgi:hypothetical protein